MKNKFNSGATSFMGPNILRTSISCAITLCSVMSVAHASSLVAVKANMLSPSSTELRLSFSESAVMPKAYQLSDPERLILDLPEVDYALPARFTRINTPQVSSVSGLDDSTLTRLVIAMPTDNEYKSRVDGNDLIILFNQKSQAVTSVPVVPVVAPSPEPYIAPIVVTEPVVYQAPVISQATPNVPVFNPGTREPAVYVDLPSNNAKLVEANPLLDERVAADIRSGFDFFGLNQIQFNKTAEDSGQVVMNLKSSDVPVDVQRKGSQLIVRMLGAKVPKNLVRRMNVADYGTPVQNVDAFNDGNNGVVVIQPKGEFDYQVYQADDLLTIDVNPIVRVRDPRPQQKTYTGEPISLDIQDAEVRRVLGTIADFTGINLVASDSVSGNITLLLDNVPWDQALDIILTSQGLDMRKNGNVIMIAPAEELAAQERQAIESQQQFKELAPLRTEYIQLNYAKAADMLTLIGQRSGGGGGVGSSAQNSLLSERGTVSIDPRTNTLVVQDTADKIDEILGLVDKLDVPVRQVMIEARVVRATDSFSKELGVKWGVLSQGIASNDSLLVGGSETTLFDLRDPDIDEDTGAVTYDIERPSNLSVDLGVTSQGASSIAFGLLEMSDLMLDLELSALQADGRGEIVASPKVLTTDKQQATVAAGTQIPYQNATASGATATEFINAELSLQVTPSITPDGRVAMELKINSDSPGEIQPSGIRAIDTNRVETNVLVDDGQTVVLGGIFQNQNNQSTTKVPLLGDLPVVGTLFRKTLNSNNKQELLIFVTPRLVNEKVTNAGL